MGISIQFLGAAGCVTGSQFLVTVGDRRVLVDCGMFQGSPQEVERNQMPFAFDPADARRAAADPRPSRPLRPDPGAHARRASADRSTPREPPSTSPTSSCATRPSSRSSSRTDGTSGRRARPSARRRGRAEQADAETQSEAVAQETDDASLPERLRHAPPEGKTVLREPLYDEHDVERAMEQMRGCDYGDEVAGHRRRHRRLPRRRPHPRLGHHRAARDRRRRGPRPSSSPATSAATARRSCATRRRSRTPSTSWSSRPTATASTPRTTRRSRSWRPPSSEVAADDGVHAHPGLRHRPHPGADLGPRRPRARRPHPARAALPRLADGLEGDRRSTTTIPRRYDEETRRARCARATRR